MSVEVTFKPAVENELHQKLKLLADFNGDHEATQAHIRCVEQWPPYDTDYGWQMTIVDKIEAMGHNTVINSGGIFGHYMNIMYGKTREERKEMYLTPNSGDTKAMGQGETKKQAIFNAIVEFVTWYNKKI